MRYKLVASVIKSFIVAQSVHYRRTSNVLELDVCANDE